MRSRTVVRLIVTSTILFLPVLAHAQDISTSALISGAVTDASGGVSPGVTVRAAIAEAFNIFDRPNWDIGTQESQRTQYLQHINAQYRSVQLGFRLTF